MEAIQKSQEELQALFLKRMDAFQADLQKSPTVTSSSLAEEFSLFRTYILMAIKSLQEQVTLLAREGDSQEMRARRKIILIHGVPEEEDEDTLASAVNIVCSKLMLTNFTSADVSQCNRMGRSSSADKPRPILLRMRDVSVRQNIWYSKTALKGTGITLSEFLTKLRHDIFLAARKRVGVSKCWTRDGSIYVVANDGKHIRIGTKADLDKIEVLASATSQNSELVVNKRPQRAARKGTLKH